MANLYLLISKREVEGEYSLTVREIEVRQCTRSQVAGPWRLSKQAAAMRAHEQLDNGL